MRFLAKCSAVALALAIPAMAFAQGGRMEGQKMAPMKAPPSKEVTVTGTVIDVSCRFGQGLRGEEHKMCAGVCADRGLPLAVLGDDGKLYIPASPAMPGDAQNNRLRQFAEEKVRISGKSFAAGGAQAIQIASIEAVK
jgi:hypothetical protein